MKRHLSIALFLCVMAAGCATSRNYQPDIDSLNAKVESLQNQVSDKNREIGGLQDQVRALQSQLEASERDKREAERRLDDALLQARKAKTVSTGYDKQATTSKPAADPYAK